MFVELQLILLDEVILEDVLDFGNRYAGAGLGAAWCRELVDVAQGTVEDVDGAVVAVEACFAGLDAGEGSEGVTAHIACASRGGHGGHRVAVRAPGCHYR